MDKGSLKLSGRYLVQHLRDGEVISEEDVSNLIVNQGLDYFLGCGVTGAQQITNWFLAPYTNNYVPVASDTAQTIVASSGEATAYAGNSRQPYTGVEGGQALTNSAAPATFTFNASITVYGAFLASGQQQQSTQGILISAAQFATPKQVVSGDQLVLTYTFSAGSA